MSTDVPRVWSKRKGAPKPPPGAVYVGRPTRFGNPFQLISAEVSDEEREKVIALYEGWVLDQPELVEAARRELRGKDLVCWCAPKACHADVLLRIANGGER